MSERVNFEASANLQRLIGRELVPDDNSAVVELVKNAYDSGATHVVVAIQPTTAKTPGSITIQDNGHGMSSASLKKYFLWAGYSDKDKDNGQRVPTGEKGIGRFASDKLGSRLIVHTKTASSKPLELAIDWSDFEDKRRRFSEISAELRAVAGRAGAEPGTKLTISGLRSAWDAPKIAMLRAHLSNLLDPFDPPRDFRMRIDVANSERLSGEVEQHSPADANIELRFSVSKRGVIKRTVTIDGKRAEPEEADTAAKGVLELAGMSGRFLYFNKRPSKLLASGAIPGVKLYRDGFRVEPLGSASADWLGIAEKRAKRAGHAHVVPSRLFGFVEISRRENKELLDTTSRQALLASGALSALLTVLREQVAFLEETIKVQTSQPRWKANRARQAQEFEQARLQTLGIMSFALAHELRQPLQSIQSEAGNIATRLVQLGIRDKDVVEAQASITRAVKRIDHNIRFVSDIARGDVQEVTEFDLQSLLQDEIVQMFAPRCATSGTKLKVEASGPHPARLNRFAVVAVVSNLVKNAIDSLSDKPGGLIVLKITRGRQRHILEVIDDGGGVPEDIRVHLFKKFATKKTGGMGVGLYYCKVIIEACGGQIDYSSRPGRTIFTIVLPEASVS